MATYGVGNLQNFIAPCLVDYWVILSWFYQLQNSLPGVESSQVRVLPIDTFLRVE